MLTNGNITNTSKNHQNIALNKDDDIGDSQIPFMSKLYFYNNTTC